MQPGSILGYFAFSCAPNFTTTGIHSSICAEIRAVQFFQTPFEYNYSENVYSPHQIFIIDLFKPKYPLAKHKILLPLEV
jgi:hypothetical protein